MFKPILRIENDKNHFLALTHPNQQKNVEQKANFSFSYKNAVESGMAHKKQKNHQKK